MTNPVGVAVDQSSGDVYIADRENRRIDKFDSDGDFLLSFGQGVADGISVTLQTCGPEATPPTSRCFRGLTNGGGGLALIPDGIAVDQTSGDVYIAESSGALRVSKFSSSGEFLLMFGKNVNKLPGTPTPNLCTAVEIGNCGTGQSGPGAGEFFTAPRSAIVDSEGHVWVGDGKRLVQFDSTGHYISQAPIPGGAEGNSFARSSGGNFYAVKPGAREEQEVSLPGITDGDTFRLGNLPAGCSSSNTDPIVYDGNMSGAALVLDALESKCGNGNFGLFGWPGAFLTIRGEGIFTAQNLGQLTCTKLTGSGSCSVATLKNGGPGEVLELEGSGSPLDTLSVVGSVYSGAPLAITIGDEDKLYIGDSIGAYKIKVFNSAGEQVSQFGAGQLIGSPGGVNGEFFSVANAMAVGETAGSLYTVSRDANVAQKFSLPGLGPLPGNSKAVDVLPTTATLTGTVNPEGHPTTYRFEYSTDESFDHATPEEALPGSGYEDEPVEAQIDHLIPETTYHFRLVAKNNCNQAEPSEVCIGTEDPTFTTPPAVEVESQWATEVSARSATIHGELDPLGVPATWWLEYGPTTSYGSNTVGQGLGGGFGAVAVATPIAGLEPNTTYHYRFAARDERDGIVYTVHGPDRTLTTQTAGLGFALADNRAWEMVSPPQKLGAVLAGTWRGLIQAAPDGNGLAYLSLASIEADPQGSRAFVASSVLGRRADDGNWSSKDITPPHGSAVPPVGGELGEFKLFSRDLATGLLQQRDEMQLSPEASERTPYLREDSEPPSFTPLVNPGNVPPGTVFGGDVKQNLGPVAISGATPDLDHVVLNSSVPLAESAPSGALYGWADGQLEPVSVLPSGEGGTISAGHLGSDEMSVRGAISEDGSRVFWSSTSPKALYVRDTAAAESARLDVVQSGATGTGGANPVFQGASNDGGAVFFTDTHQLTANASPTGRDLYRCLLGSSGSGCTTLTDISAPPGGGEESAEVQGLVSGLSEDGTRLYFVAEGVLDATPSQGEAAQQGEPNLYMWTEGQGVRFIARLSPEDATSWGAGADEGAFRLTAAASPEANYLTFMSQRELGGAEFLAGGADPVEQVYLYDAASERLSCVSCKPHGGAAQGTTITTNPLTRPLIDQQGLWHGRDLAAAVPEASSQSESASISLYRPRSVFDSGRAFFNAFDPLVPADTNGNWDVYQWEPLGVGDCTPSSGDSDTARSGEGCVSLLSSGTAGETGFLDASASGNDVFFLTLAQLSVTDQDEELDVYDARVNGIPAVLEPTPECLGETCQPAPQAPNDATPASSSFQGPGNVKPGKPRCPKGKRAVRRKGKTRCVPKERKRHRQQGRAAKTKGQAG